MLSYRDNLTETRDKLSPIRRTATKLFGDFGELGNRRHCYSATLLFGDFGELVNRRHCYSATLANLEIGDKAIRRLLRTRQRATNFCRRFGDFGKPRLIFVADSATSENRDSFLSPIRRPRHSSQMSGRRHRRPRHKKSRRIGDRDFFPR